MISYFSFRLGCGALRVLVHVQLEELARVNRIIDELLFLSRADAHAITVDLREQVPAAFLSTFAQDAAALAEHHGRRFSYRHQGEGAAVFEEKRMRQVLLNLRPRAASPTIAPGLPARRVLTPVV
jgi:signal transduction histidine kinase